MWGTQLMNPTFGRLTPPISGKMGRASQHYRCNAENLDEPGGADQEYQRLKRENQH